MTDESLPLLMQHACAVFGPQGLVLANAAYTACFGRDYRPPVAAGDLAFVHVKDPVPHVSSRRDFSLEGESYTLFAVVLYGGEENAWDAELALNRVDSVLGHLLSVATDGGKGTPMSIMEVYGSVGNLLKESVSRDIRVLLAPSSLGMVMLDHSALAMAVGLLISDLLAAGDVELCLLQNSFSAFTLYLRAAGVTVSPFVKALSLALAKGGGFLLDISEQGVTFTLSRCEAVGHMFYAGTCVCDEKDYFCAARLLRL